MDRREFLRASALMQWPAAWTAGVARGIVLTQPVELRDILPTFLDAAGADIPSKMDGRSLLSLARDPGRQPGARRSI